MCFGGQPQVINQPVPTPAPPAPTNDPIQFGKPTIRRRKTPRLNNPNVMGSRLQVPLGVRNEGSGLRIPSGG